MDVIIIGAGKIGSTIAKLLYHDKEYDVTLASRNEKALLTLQKKNTLPYKTNRRNRYKESLKYFKRVRCSSFSSLVLLQPYYRTGCA